MFHIRLDERATFGVWLIHYLLFRLNLGGVWNPSDTSLICLLSELWNFFLYYRFLKYLNADVYLLRDSMIKWGLQMRRVQGSSKYCYQLDKLHYFQIANAHPLDKCVASGIVKIQTIKYITKKWKMEWYTQSDCSNLYQCQRQIWYLPLSYSWSAAYMRFFLLNHFKIKHRSSRFLTSEAVGNVYSFIERNLFWFSQQK